MICKRAFWCKFCDCTELRTMRTLLVHFASEHFGANLNVTVTRTTLVQIVQARILVQIGMWSYRLSKNNFSWCIIVVRSENHQKRDATNWTNVVTICTKKVHQKCAPHSVLFPPGPWDANPQINCTRPNSAFTDLVCMATEILRCQTLLLSANVCATPP